MKNDEQPGRSGASLSCSTIGGTGARSSRKYARCVARSRSSRGRSRGAVSALADVRALDGRRQTSLHRNRARGSRSRTRTPPRSMPARTAGSPRGPVRQLRRSDPDQRREDHADVERPRDHPHGERIRLRSVFPPPESWPDRQDRHYRPWSRSADRLRSRRREEFVDVGVTWRTTS